MTSLDDQLRLLTCGDVEIVGRMPWSSNATFLVDVVSSAPSDASSAESGRSTGNAHDAPTSHRAIYKPVRGERPLWDFDTGLHRRELAAFRLAESLGLGNVPATVIRDGPLGEGSLQWYVDAAHEEHYFTMYETMPDLHDQLRTIALFDVIANNTDRKSGHCLLDDGHVWAIDHGLCFAAEFKLRTVIWEFGGEPIDDASLDLIRPLVDAVPLDVATLLADDEVAALSERSRLLIDLGHFPIDQSGRRYPWPLV